MHVVFLDLDGVTHPLGIKPTGIVVNGKPLVRATSVDYFCWLPFLVNAVLKAPGVYIVIHSMWRKSHSLETIKTKIASRWPDLDLSRIIDSTNPNLSKKSSIEEWMSKQTRVVKSFIILDDALEFEHYDQWIACESESGLSDIHVQEKIQHWINRYQNMDRLVKAIHTSPLFEVKNILASIQHALHRNPASFDNDAAPSGPKDNQS